MGKIGLTYDSVANTLTIDYSAITADQLTWAKKARGYSDTIDDPQNPGSQIANPVPFVPWLFAAALQKLSDDAMAQYKAETPDPRDVEAEAIGNFVPTLQ